jgi:hypothetical protein
MDCRQALQILDFEDPRADGLPSEVCSVEERAAAEAHLESCPGCARTVRNRGDLDQTIGRMMRSVPIPRGAQQRLLARLSETAAVTTTSKNGEPGHPVASGASGSNGVAAGDLPSVVSAGVPRISRVLSRRRLLKSLVPLVACAVALVGFFGVVWLFTPRWTVDDISQSMARIDFQQLQTLEDFRGKAAAGHLPEESGWQQLQWACGRRAKGLPLASSAIAVYGFTIPETHGHSAINGLIAVIPQNLIRDRPAAGSLSVAAPIGGYLPARIGESSCVAWWEGDVVCVCLIQGGADSLSILQNALAEPAA